MLILHDELFSIVSILPFVETSLALKESGQELIGSHLLNFTLIQDSDLSP